MDKKNCTSLCKPDFCKYAKNLGLASYAGLGVAISQPSIVRSGNLDLTTSLLLGSFVTTGTYIYTRKHLAKVETKKRVWLSMYGSGLFNLGSVLIWALAKAATQDYNLHPIFRGFLSLVGSYYMVQSGVSWIKLMDNSEQASQ